MKKIIQGKYVVLVVIAFVTGLFIHVPTTAAANVDTSRCTAQTFKVTAYYSPLPDQDYYYRSSYYDEIILNGRGTNGASGAPVFNGMIAAPSSYQFGTKIYFPGWGVGQVEDRGGAIVHQGERNQQHDRIDIWAGKGEEGLRRALSFGVQYIDAYICPGDAVPSSIGFDYDAFPVFNNFFEKIIWIMSLEPGREDRFVQSLQRYLAALGYMDESLTTGKYGRVTKAAVCMFQQKHLGLPSYHQACGWFGPQTRAALREVVTQQGIRLVPLDQETEQSFAGEYIVEDTTGVIEDQEAFHDHLFTEGEFSEYQFTRSFVKGTKDKAIRILQRKLSRLGYYLQREITGIYDMNTIDAVYEFQLDEEILTGNEDPGVKGWFGPKTREAMNKL